MRGKGEVGKSPKPGDKWLPAGVTVLQCKFFCGGEAVLVTAVPAVGSRGLAGNGTARGPILQVSLGVCQGLCAT